jgi:hypothetical protein
LPQRALGELAILLLEHMGFTDLVSVRRPATYGAELHLSARARSSGGEVRTAIVVRRDGREIGRERVTELRGALHHYGPAQAGLILTTGAALSGAKEEASALGAAPIAVIDGFELSRLCEEHSVGFVRGETPMPIPDFELLDSLR